MSVTPRSSFFSTTTIVTDLTLVSIHCPRSKDCIILETYLEHIRSARRAGLGASIVFVSSNTTDYAPSAARLTEDMASEFADLEMGFAPNMAAAKVLLGL